MFHFLFNFLIFCVLIERFLVFASLINQYKDYRLYSVQMPSNYELVNSDLLASLIDKKEEYETEVDVDKSLKERNSTRQRDQRENFSNKKGSEEYGNNLFFVLMNQLSSNAPVDFWQLNINHSLFTVSPEYHVLVEDYLLNNSLNFDVIDENIQNRLNQVQYDITRTDFFNVHLNVNSSFKLDTYHSLDEINDYLRYLAKRYPETVRVNSIGQTFEKRDILAVTIRKKSNLKRPSIVVDAGIHPREWITQASALVLITKLVYYFNMDASHTVLDQLAFYHNQTEADLVSPIDWTIIPVLNPDGYLHTWLNDRLYRKNRAIPRAKPKRAIWNFFSECVGIDLNRNFEYYFAYSAQSSNPCNDIFAGDSAFSELESSALRTLVLASRPQAYISLHSFGQLITFPNQINRAKLPNHNQLKEVAKKMSEAMKELEGKEYRYGQISKFNYGVIGDSVGWASMNGVNLTYRIDLRDKGALGYVLPKSQIVSNGEEVLKGLIVIANEVRTSFKGN